MVEHTFRTLSAHVKSQKNRFCKISNLPTEILREIFLSTCENGFRWWDLASILKTCKPWYQILAHDPSAYSAMSLGNNGRSRRRAESFAERSVSLPLSVVWVETNMSKHTSVWKSDFCTQYLARIKTLEYTQFDALADNWLRQLPAPQLERCELSCDVYYDDDDEDVEEDQIDLSLSTDVLPFLFGGKTPKLRVLGLNDVRLAWGPGNYNDLTHLTITASPRTFAQKSIDSDNVTIIFRDSPRLEHIALIASGAEVWWTLMGENAPSRDVTRRRHSMGRLRTLRLHLSASYVLSILRAIEITPTITTVDLRCGDAGDVYERSIEVLDTDVLPDFLLAKLQSLSFGWQGSRRGVSGSGVLADHEYSFICTPLNNPVELSWKIGFVQRLLELKHLKLPAESIHCLMRFLVASPALDEVEIWGGRVFNATKALRGLLFDPQGHIYLSRVSRWSFTSDGPGTTPLQLFRRDTRSLVEFFQLLPTGQRSLFIDGSVQLGLHLAREFVVDLARLNVAIEEPADFMLGHDDTLEEIRISSVRALWADDEVPTIVQEVMTRCV